MRKPNVYAGPYGFTALDPLQTPKRVGVPHNLNPNPKLNLVTLDPPLLSLLTPVQFFGNPGDPLVSSTALSR